MMVEIDEWNFDKFLYLSFSVDRVTRTSHTVRSSCCRIRYSIDRISGLAFTRRQAFVQTETVPIVLERTLAQTRIVLREAFIGIRFCIETNSTSSA